MKIIKFLFRLISFPFFLGLLLVSLLRVVLFKSALWLWYGGETISYHKSFNPVTVAELLKELKPKEP